MSPLREGVQRRLQAIDDALSQHTRYRIARNAVVGFNQRDGQRKAAAMTYFAVFSFFPFILLLIALLSFALESEQAQAQALMLLSSFFPVGATVVQTVVKGVTSARGPAAGLGIVFLLWGALGWFESIDRGVNEMWGVESTRSFLKGKLFALAMIVGIAVVMLLSWAANITIGVTRDWAPSLGLATPGATWDVIVAFLSVGFMFLLFLLLFRFSPMCNLTWSEIWRGALVTAVLWEVLRSGFALYVTNFADFSTAYGPLGAAIAFLFWLFLAHNVLLLGAKLTYVTRLESWGIHELRDLPCALPKEGSGGPPWSVDRTAA